MEGRREGSVQDLSALPDRVRKEIEQFALAATALEGKDVRIVGWSDRAAALQLVRASAIQ